MSTSDVFPLFVHDATGKPGEALTDTDLAQVGPDLPDAAARALGQTHLAADASVDPADLTQTGWGVLFAADLDPKVKEQLQPLLDWRRSQIPKPKGARPDLYQEFTVPVGMTANSWTVGLGVTLTGSVRPWKGVPYYLLIVGSPQSISFEFQALLKMQWAVGRVYFDDVEDYGKYAAPVVAYESGAEVAQSRSAAVWLTCNPGDPATTMLSTALKADFMDDEDHVLGEHSNFEVQAFIGDKAATKAQLAEILKGNLANGRPAVLFTGSHGLKCGLGDPARQAAAQGALITQEYDPKAPSDASTWTFTGADVPAEARLDGTMVFLFACFSCGCPKNDTYNVQANGAPVQIATGDMISRLAQVLLSRGALGVFGHVDAAYAYSFGGLNGPNGPQQPQVIRDPLERLMQGRPAGWAADALTQSWTNLSAMWSESKPLAAGGTAAAGDLAQYGKLGIARDDARNYILLGDPAARLRVKDLKDPGAV